MARKADGSRALPLRHISIRVPWHDDGWNGCICIKPKPNTACQALARIREAENILCKLNEDDLEQEQSITRITGTSVGQDATTQIITLVQGELISLRRNVEQSVQVDLNSSQGYTVIFIQNGVSNTVKINGGGDSVIKIVQGS